MHAELETNPFQSPTECEEQPADLDAPVYFGGVINEAEGRELNQLLRGQMAKHVSPAQLFFIGVASLLVVAFFAAEALYYDEPDALLNVGLGLVVIVVALSAATYQQQVDKCRIAELRSQGKGVFTSLAGRVNQEGIEYLIGYYPIRYRWRDFVGCRLGQSTALLYVSYPKEVNLLAASLFESAYDWESVRALVQVNMPGLGRFPKLSVRKSSPMMTHIAGGIRALHDQAWQQALNEFDNALAVDPADLQALQGRLIAVVGSQDIDRAEALLAEILALGPPEPMARRMRATIMICRNRFAEALEELDWLIDRDGRNSDLLRDRGLALLKLERTDEALRDTSAAIQLNSEDAVALNNRGAIHLKLGRKEAAIADLEAAIRIDPSFERPRILLDEAMRHEQSTAVPS